MNKKERVSIDTTSELQIPRYKAFLDFTVEYDNEQSDRAFIICSLSADLKLEVIGCLREMADNLEQLTSPEHKTT